MPATMRAEDLIAAVQSAGGTIRRDGEMIELAAPRPLPPDLVTRIREAKLALLSALGDGTDWRARYREALACWGALHPAGEAARLAWGEMLNRWHRLHSRPLPVWQCAGCDQMIGGLAAMTLADGNRVHLAKFDCVFSFGERWRGEAAAGLRTLGLDPPPGFELL